MPRLVCGGGNGRPIPVPPVETQAEKAVKMRRALELIAEVDVHTYYNSDYRSAFERVQQAAKEALK